MPNWQGHQYYFFPSLTIQRAINTLGIVAGSIIAATNIDWIHGNSGLDIFPMAAIDENQAQPTIKITQRKALSGKHNGIKGH